MRTLLLASMVSFALVGFGGVALADDDPTTPPTEPSAPTSTTEPTSSTSVPAEEPAAPPAPNEGEKPPGAEDLNQEEPPSISPLVSAGSGCAEGFGFVDVDVKNPNDTEVTYEVKLFTSSDFEQPPVQEQQVTIAAGETETVSFDKLAAGSYHVLASGNDGTGTVDVTDVDRCEEIGPIDDPLQVFVRCVDGEGLVTIRVFNLEGDVRTYTVSVEDLQLPGDIELGAGEFAVVVDEAPLPDGSFKVQVKAEGIDHTETVTVACAPPPTTTTQPPPQARPAPASNSGGLATTGAAVGGMALLGLLALGLGGGLVIVGRRRRTKAAEGTDV